MSECPFSAQSTPSRASIEEHQRCPVGQSNAQQDTASVMLRLRTETRPQHDHIESVPFSLAMQEGTLPRSSFVAQMMCWERVHGTLESSLADSRDEAVRAVWRPEMARTGHIRADMAHHGEGSLNDQTIAATDATVTWISSLAQDDPRALLGCLYVLEGSKMGGTILRRCLSEAYDCPPEHLSYFWASSDTSPKPDWDRFKGRMDPALGCREDQDRAIAAAGDMFDHLTEILLAIGVE